MDDAIQQHPVFLEIKARAGRALERERSAGTRCLIERALKELAEQLADIQSRYDEAADDTFYRDLELESATHGAQYEIDRAVCEDELPERRYRSELSLAQYESYVEGFQDGYRRRGLLNRLFG